MSVREDGRVLKFVHFQIENQMGGRHTKAKKISVVGAEANMK